MNEELGYEVTPKQSLDGLWKTMHKYIEHHGYSDISLEIEGSQYEFRQHLQKYDEYEAKAKAFDRIVEQRKKTGVITLGHHALEIIKEYESGDYDA